MDENFNNTKIDEFLNKKQVLRIACTTNSTLYRWMNKGYFPKVVMQPNAFCKMTKA